MKPFNDYSIAFVLLLIEFRLVGNNISIVLKSTRQGWNLKIR